MLMRRVCLSLTGTAFIILAAACNHADSATPKAVTKPAVRQPIKYEGFEVGIWLNHGLMAKGDAEIVKFLDEAQRRGVTAIYPNFWYHGCVIYPGSELASQHQEVLGRDPLRTVITEAHKRGMKVYPWLEYGFFASYNTTNNEKDPGYILEKHPDWEVMSKDGRISVYNPSIKVTHFSMNPGNAEARKFLRDICLEMIAKYPEVEGLHLDRIRYQSADFSYDEKSRDAFKKVNGVDPKMIDPADKAMQAKWDAWREEQVTAFVRELSKDMRAKWPFKEINGAVVPPYIQAEKFQRWDIWAKEGYIDRPEPMFYGNLALCKKEIDKTVAMLPPGQPMSAGLDVGMGDEPLKEAIDYAKSKGAVGILLWDDVGFQRTQMSFQPWSGHGDPPAGSTTTPSAADPNAPRALTGDIY
ncbi:hypothetical protein BH09SUM1_BH09SUM1_13770 [soil metagenome]